MRYRSKCRFNFLLDLDSLIIEIRPNQEFESDKVINHPNIMLVEEEKKNDKSTKKTS